MSGNTAALSTIIVSVLAQLFQFIIEEVTLEQCLPTSVPQGTLRCATKDLLCMGEVIE